MTYAGYCSIDLIKDRILDPHSDTQYNADLEAAGTEASRVVDIFLKPYTTVPLSGTIPDAVVIITADFAASVFKRRMLPEEVKMQPELTPENLNQMEATGWFAQGMKKLQEYIRSYYTLAQGFSEDGAAVHNPMAYAELVKRGVITAKEARAMLSAANSIVNHIIDEICKTITISEIKDKVETVSTTEQRYDTKKQKSFVFVRSNKNGGYEKDT